MATPDSPDLLITNSENIIYLESGQKKPAFVIWMLHRLSIHLKMKYLSLLCILMLIFSGCNHPKDEILFSSSRPGNSDIYLMDVRTTTMHQLTDGASEEWAPVWISKEEIAFLSQQDDSITIQKLHIPTRKITGLPHPANCILNDKNYVYSDKSDKRLYLCDGDIFLLHDDNHTPVNLTENITGTANYPAWGADDTILTFTSNHEGSNNIYFLNIETNELQIISQSDANDERGDVSPDGKWIVYSSDRFDKGNQDLILQNLSTQAFERITNSPGAELIGRWSPSGQTIYF